MIETQLEEWHDFYVVLGSAGAALTGLLFVIVSLAPQLVARHAKTGVRAFITPIAVHFTTALVLSAIMLSPGLSPIILGGLVAVGGIGGVIFTAWTRVHSRWREGNLGSLDWIWFVGLPFLGFLLIGSAGVAIAMQWMPGLYGVAGATVLMIVVGIRNGWDIVLWITQRPHT